MAFRAGSRESHPWPPITHDGLDRSPHMNDGRRRISDYSRDPEPSHDVHFRAARRTDPELPCSESWCQSAQFEPLPPHNESFFALRRQSPPSSCSMERTASGLSISSDSTLESSSMSHDEGLMQDKEAAERVERHLSAHRRRATCSRHERILRSLIQPRSREAEFSIDNAALESIFSAANELFFGNRLSRRVTWDWSHSSSFKYDDHIIGTTALRRCLFQPGYETLIVLSQPILRDQKYNRRLLISTFLHELIHSYLFICCGPMARKCGGHTDGFKHIAALIDRWAGPDNLHLRNMEADLDNFKEDVDEARGAPTSMPQPAPALLDPSTAPHSRHASPSPIQARAPSLLCEKPAHQNRWGSWVLDYQEHIPLSTTNNQTLTPSHMGYARGCNGFYTNLLDNPRLHVQHLSAATPGVAPGQTPKYASTWVHADDFEPCYYPKSNRDRSWNGVWHDISRPASLGPGHAPSAFDPPIR